MQNAFEEKLKQKDHENFVLARDLNFKLEEKNNELKREKDLSDLQKAS